MDVGDSSKHQDRIPDTIAASAGGESVNHATFRRLPRRASINLGSLALSRLPDHVQSIASPKSERLQSPDDKSKQITAHSVLPSRQPDLSAVPRQAQTKNVSLNSYESTFVSAPLVNADDEAPGSRIERKKTTQSARQRSQESRRRILNATTRRIAGAQIEQQKRNAQLSAINYDLTLVPEWSNILNIMKKLKGVLRSWARWQTPSAHGSGYCYTEEFSGALLFEEQSSTHVLMADLRGCHVSLSESSPMALVVQSANDPDLFVILGSESTLEFNNWLAVFLTWSPLRTAGLSNKLVRFKYPRLDFGQKLSSTESSSDRVNSQQSCSTVPSVRTIKVGQLEIWDPTIAKRNPKKVKQLVTITKNWIPASCMLKTNGDLQIFPDFQSKSQSAPLPGTLYGSLGASLSTANIGSGSAQPSAGATTVDMSQSNVIVIALSTLSRMEIQFADRSITNREHCIVIFLRFPNSNSSSTSSTHSSSSSSSHNSHQHNHSLSTASSTSTNNQPKYATAPIYLSFDTRVNCEVWYVLLKSLSLPELYGPDTGSVYGTFRQHRAFTIRVLEARVLWPRGPTMSPESSLAAKAADTYVEISLDDKVRARTRVKYSTSKPFWRQDFSFSNLPSHINSVKLSLKLRNKRSKDYQSDQTLGEVRLSLDEVEKETEVEQWIPMHNPTRGYIGKTAEVCTRLKLTDYTILAGREYEPILSLLLDFSNHLTIEIAQLIGDLKRVSTTLLDIYQASGQATEWLITLADDEVGESGSSSQEFPSVVLNPVFVQNPENIQAFKRISSPALVQSSNLTSLNSPFASQYATRSNSFDESETSSGTSTLSPGTLSPAESSGHESRSPAPGHSGASSPRLPVINAASALADANLLFRGNSLLTKSLDAHMRRIGSDYLLETIGDLVQRVIDENLSCEVDPCKLSADESLDENWNKLLAYMTIFWNRVQSSSRSCPPALRRIFHNIRLQVENKFGEFLLAASYSGVSGFLFLRFFCPAVLNPKLFDLVNDHPPSRAQRTLTLIAKGLQGLANRTHFGYKEPWMSPMNTFLNDHIQEVNQFIADVSTWRSSIYPQISKGIADVSMVNQASIMKDDELDDNEIDASKRSLSKFPYRIPNAILSCLQEEFKDSTPTLPYLIDRPAAISDLVTIWLSWYDAKVLAWQAELEADKFSGHRGSLYDEEGEGEQRELEADRINYAASIAEIVNSLPDTYATDDDTESSTTSTTSAEDEILFTPARKHGGTAHAVPVDKSDKDMPSGLRFSGAVREFHNECVRIRDATQKLKYKSSIPEIPSEVPEDTWDYFVTNFLDATDFEFSQKRGTALKSLYATSAAVAEGGDNAGKNTIPAGGVVISNMHEVAPPAVLSNANDQDNHNLKLSFEHADNENDAITNLEHDPHGGHNNESSSAESSSLGNFTSTVSRGIGTLQRKSKSLRQPWRKILGNK
ncbi:hypothetical protein V1514DRAFT_329875 [Lipomyces japonicus]|uniref:uncharacterized protein n=1 Tax=Lipomyces japonicus TaxID=56871 RepID=UPI0034CE981D